MNIKREGHWLFRPCHHVLILNPNDGSILTLEDLTLPFIRYDSQSYPEIHDVCQLVKFTLRLEVDIMLLRQDCIEIYGGIYNPTLLIFRVIELGNDHQAPSGCTWVSRGEVNQINVNPSNEQVLSFLQRYMATGRISDDGRSHPFSTPVSYLEVAAWAQNNITQVTSERVVFIKQAYMTHRYCALLVQTDRGSQYWLKAFTECIDCREIEITFQIGNHLQPLLDQPLAIEWQRRWILTRFRTPIEIPLTRIGAEPIHVVKVLIDWGSIQRQSIDHARNLAQSGVPMFDKFGIGRKIETMIQSDDWFQAQRDGQCRNKLPLYTRVEFNMKLLRYVESLCNAISRYELPLTLVHGCLEANSVVWKDENICRFINFGNGCISYPFLDAIHFVEYSGVDEKYLEYYLQMWTDYQPMHKLKELVKLVRKVDIIHSHLEHFRNFKHCDNSMKQIAYGEMSEPMSKLFETT